MRYQCWDNKRLKRHNVGIIRKKEPEVLALAETGGKSFATVLTLNTFGKRCICAYSEIRRTTK